VIDFFEAPFIYSFGRGIRCFAINWFAIASSPYASSPHAPVSHMRQFVICASLLYAPVRHMRQFADRALCNERASIRTNVHAFWRACTFLWVCALAWQTNYGELAHMANLHMAKRHHILSEDPHTVYLVKSSRYELPFFQPTRCGGSKPHT